MIYRLLLLMLILLVSLKTRAACTSPSAGVAGQLKYDTTFSTLMYCNGTYWFDTKQSVGVSCAGTTAGTTQYTASSMRFCNGSNWIWMKGAALGTDCSGTTAGTFNYVSGKYQMTDGTTCYDLTGPNAIIKASSDDGCPAADTVTITNYTGVTTGALTVSIGGGAPTWNTDTCTGNTLAPLATCSINVTGGAQNDWINISAANTNTISIRIEYLACSH